MSITASRLSIEVERYNVFIEKFIEPSYGIIALNNGYSLETACKAGLLKDEYISPLDMAELEQASEARAGIEFIDQFKSAEQGVIALKWGYSIEDAREADLLK